MCFDMNLFRNREIIFVNEESFGVTCTHWTRRGNRWSWSLRWENVLAIEAMQIEPASIGFVFVTLEERWRFLAEDMENWSALKEAVRMRYPGFNWDNFELAKNYIDTRIPCWKRSS